jgi:hypothetical protein
LNRILLAFRCFFAILFHGQLSADALGDLKLGRREQAAPGGVPSGPGTPPAAPPRTPADGALQLLTILQRDSRLVDFLMEDIASYSDDQVGAAVRELHDQCRDSIKRYVALQPVIDGVEGTPVKAPSRDPNAVRFIGNVPATPPPGGTLRHKGWRAAKVDLPGLTAKEDTTIIAPAEIEIE